MRLQPGKYQTRNSRVVVLHRWRLVTRLDKDKKEYQARVWDGTLFKADGRTEDSNVTFEDNGQKANSQGVASQFDLAQLIQATGPYPEDENKPDPLADLQARHAELESAHRDLTLRYEDLAGRHRELTAHAAEMQDAFAELESAHRDLTLTYDDLAGRHRELTAQAAEMQDALGKLRDQLSGAPSSEPAPAA